MGLSIIFLFFVLISIIKTSKIIELNYRKKSYISKVKLEFNDLNISYSGWVNTYIPFSIFREGILDRGTPKEMRKLELKQEYICNQFQTEIKINDCIAPDFNYFYSDDINYIPEQGYSFAHKFEDESFSLIHLLYKNNQIGRRVFAYQTDNQKMFFGGVPENINQTYKGTVFIKDSSPLWETKLNTLHINNQVFELNNTRVVFHSAFFNLISSNEFFDFITDEILKKEIQNELCNKQEVDSDYHEYGLSCKKEALENFGSIEFHFEDIVLTLHKQDLFFEFNETIMNSNFISNPYKHYNFTIIGFEFIELFNYSVFDYDQHSITFYSDTTLIKSIRGKEGFNSVQGFYLVIIILCICTIFYDGFIFLKKLCVIN